MTLHIWFSKVFQECIFWMEQSSIAGDKVQEIERSPVIGWACGVGAEQQLQLANRQTTWTTSGIFKPILGAPAPGPAPGTGYRPALPLQWRLNARKYDKVPYSCKQRYELIHSATRWLVEGFENTTILTITRQYTGIFRRTLNLLYHCSLI